MTLPVDQRSTEADAQRVYCFLSQAIALAYFLDDNSAQRVKDLLADAFMTPTATAAASTTSAKDNGRDPKATATRRRFPDAPTSYQFRVTERQTQ